MNVKILVHKKVIQIKKRWIWLLSKCHVTLPLPNSTRMTLVSTLITPIIPMLDSIWLISTLEHWKFLSLPEQHVTEALGE